MKPMAALATLLVFACGPSKSSVAPTKPPAEPAADPLANRPVVENTAAKTGDVTTCPFSGRNFEVKDDSPRWEYEGKTYVFCAQQALDEVKKDPAKYLGERPAP